MAFELLGISADGHARWSRPRTARRGRSAEDCGRLVMELLERGPAAERRSSRASRSRTRSPRRGHRRLHQRRAAPAGRRPRGRRAARRSTTSTASARRTPLLADLKPGGRYVATDLYRAGGVPPSSPSGCMEAGLLHEDALTVTGRTIGEEADAAEEPEGQEVIRPLDSPIKPNRRPRDPARQPRARGLRGEARRPRPRRAPRPGARVRVARRTRSPPSRRARSRPGDVVVIRNEGPTGGPGMREMLARHRRARGRGARRLGRAAHRRPLLRRHPRPHGRPRGPRGAARRPDRRGARRRHRSCSTSPNRELRPRADRRRDRRARRGLRARPRRATRAACSASTRSYVGSAVRGRAHGSSSAAWRPQRRRRCSRPLSLRRAPLLDEELHQHVVERLRPLDHRHVAGVLEHAPCARRGISALVLVGVAAAARACRPSPHTISVGQRDLGQPVAEVVVEDRAQRVREARAVPAPLAAALVGEVGRAAGAGWRSHERRARGGAGRAAGRALAGARGARTRRAPRRRGRQVRIGPRRRSVRRDAGGGHEHQPLDPLRELDRHLGRDEAAHRVARRARPRRGRARRTARPPRGRSR